MNDLPGLRLLRWPALAVFLCLAAGCRDRNTPAPPMAETPLTRNTSTSDLQGRLTAAQAIFDTNKRDDALRAVADAAGEAGEPGVVKAAVGAIFDTNKKDAAADSAAVALARAGKRIEATAVARMIFDTVKKDATLSKLAKN